MLWLFFFSSRRRHTRCALVTGVQTCALPIYERVSVGKHVPYALDIIVHGGDGLVQLMRQGGRHRSHCTYAGGMNEAGPQLFHFLLRPLPLGQVADKETGRAPWRGRAGKYVLITVVAVS